jgi:hypothetical protein
MHRTVRVAESYEETIMPSMGIARAASSRRPS